MSQNEGLGKGNAEIALRDNVLLRWGAWARIWTRLFVFADWRSLKLQSLLMLYEMVAAAAPFVGKPKKLSGAVIG